MLASIKFTDFFIVKEYVQELDAIAEKYSSTREEIIEAVQRMDKVYIPIVKPEQPL